MLILAGSHLLAQTHHLVENNVSDGSNRVMSVVHNANNGNKGYTGFNLWTGTGSNQGIAHISQTNHNYTAIPEWKGVLGIFSGSGSSGTGNGINLCALQGLGKIRFYALGTQPSNLRMTLTSNGNFGIGVAEPEERLQVANGDIYLSDINSGVIMKSPNGTCFRMSIQDDGTPLYTQLGSCPED